MHFVAMLAFIMPTPMSYDIGLTTLSLVVAMFVTGGGFYVISRHSGSLLRLVLSGIFMGLGIAAMHYTGMAAMREHVDLSYDRIFVALSLIIAIGASTAALWLAFRTTDLGQKLIAAVVMGLAISGMQLHGDGRDHFCSSRPGSRGPRIRKSRSHQSGPGRCWYYVCHSSLRIDCLPVRAESAPKKRFVRRRRISHT